MHATILSYRYSWSGSNVACSWHKLACVVCRGRVQPTFAGAASMHDLTCLLNGAAQCSLAAVSAALPCPGLPDERHLAEARDHRTRHRAASPSSRPDSESPCFHASQHEQLAGLKHSSCMIAACSVISAMFMMCVMSVPSVRPATTAYRLMDKVQHSMLEPRHAGPVWAGPG